MRHQPNTHYPKRKQENKPQNSEQEDKRYNLVINRDLFWEVEQIAKRDNVKVIDVLRKFIKVGLLVDRVQNTPDASLIIRQGDNERVVILI